MLQRHFTVTLPAALSGLSLCSRERFDAVARKHLLRTKQRNRPTRRLPLCRLFAVCALTLASSSRFERKVTAANAQQSVLNDVERRVSCGACAHMQDFTPREKLGRGTNANAKNKGYQQTDGDKSMEHLTVHRIQVEVFTSGCRRARLVARWSLRAGLERSDIVSERNPETGSGAILPRRLEPVLPSRRPSPSRGSARGRP